MSTLEVMTTLIDKAWKFNPLQARWPKGTGDKAGEWRDDGVPNKKPAAKKAAPKKKPAAKKAAPKKPVVMNGKEFDAAERRRAAAKKAAATRARNKAAKAAAPKSLPPAKAKLGGKELREALIRMGHLEVAPEVEVKPFTDGDSLAAKYQLGEYVEKPIPSPGAMATKIVILDFNDGTRGVLKETRIPAETAYEIAVNKIARFMGIRAPRAEPIHETGFVMEFVQDHREFDEDGYWVGAAGDWDTHKAYLDGFFFTDQGKLVGLLDAMTGNLDRHAMNWMADEKGNLVPIDNAGFIAPVAKPMPDGTTRYSSPNSPFAWYLYEKGVDGYVQYWKSNDFTKNDFARLRAFVVANKGDWLKDRMAGAETYELVLKRLDAIADKAEGTKDRLPKSSIYKRDAVDINDLAKRFNKNQPRWPKGSGDRSGEFRDVFGNDTRDLAREIPANRHISTTTGYHGNDRRHEYRNSRRGNDGVWTPEKRARVRAGGSSFTEDGRKVQQDVVTTLNDMVARIRANNPGPHPKVESKPLTTYKGKAALRWANQTGHISWGESADAKGAVNIVGEGKAGAYVLKGDTRRGFHVEVSSNRLVPNGPPGLLRDEDGSLVKYVDRADAQDAAREFDEWFANLGRR